MQIDKRVADIVLNDVISSSTPLEMHLAGVHPRLHYTADRLANIQKNKERAPYRSMLAGMARAAVKLEESPLLSEDDKGQPIKTANFQASGADKREYGDRIYQAAGHFLLSGEPRSRERALDVMRALAAYSQWGSSLMYGHWAHGMACGIDWLWDEIDEAERNYFLDTLYARTEHVFGEWASYRSGEPFGYTWNIMGVILGGLGAAAGVLYGERPDVARMVNLVTEKTRASANALGDDGVSPEGMAYGSYYVTFMTYAFTFVRDLVGVDLYQTCPWFRAFPDAIRHHSLPRDSWKIVRRCFQFGDAHRDNHGSSPSDALWACARAYGDGRAQTLANDISNGGGGPISAFHFDPDVSPTSPDAAETLKHFKDLGIVIGRTDWSGSESAFAVKCGAPNGHKGMTQYTNPLAGGHMQPSAGVVQIFSHGQWILAHPGYTWKDTSYHNCMIVDGVGQEGSDSEWFEDLAFRQGAPCPHIVRVASASWGDYVLANPGPAYRKGSYVSLYYRHVFFIKPDCWIVVDAVRFARPATPEVLWHTLTPMTQLRAGCYTTTHDTAHARISVPLQQAWRSRWSSRPFCTAVVMRSIRVRSCVSGLLNL